MDSTAEKLYTADEFFMAIPETKEHYELHDGEIVALASPSVLHHNISTEVFSALRDYVRSKGGRCKPFIAPLDVKLDDHNVVQPDVFVVCRPEIIGEKRINGAPDLVIEVMSDNRYTDLVKKLELYGRFGVREYWIVDPKNEKTLVYFFEKNEYPAIYPFSEPVPVGIYDGELSINISELTK
ncbi:MAG: Uma2 family endonuclease [Ruminococcus sp.]|nr:Uma2 family endonuclease [Ruminococcus sp.]